jgi:predicted DNA-binding transcriptional regulator YafY
MQNESQITAFVLSLGSKCEVIEPKNIKDSVTKEVLKLKELYGI